MEINEKLREKLNNLPSKAGVYLYKNKNGKIIYVGKAKNLRNRVRSYFQEGRPVDAKTKALLQKIEDLDIILVDSEAEALILEDTLIKRHKPRYNVQLRDDKSYPYVRVTNEPYPRVFTTRNVVRDGSKYFGPFTEVKALNHLMRTIRSLFMIRSCNLNINEETIKEQKHKVCLDYHINKCEGPCEGLVSFEKYNNNIKMAKKVLQGKTSDVEKELKEEMERLSIKLKFEEAAVIRNRLQTLKSYTEKQKIVTTDIIDRDVFGYYKEEENACTLVLKIREGKLTGKRHYIVKNAEAQPDARIIQRSVEKWYLETDFIPKEVYLPDEVEDIEYLSDWLSKRSERSIRINIPQIGDKKKLVNMAGTNAKFILKEYLLALAKRDQVVPRPVMSLKRDLKLEKLPIRIECFDNSHIQGSELVSSLVVFEDGKPKKTAYRKFKIRTVHQNDDFAAMKEAVERRYTRLLNDIHNGEKEAKLPELIIIDGGKGQLSGAYSILKKLGIENDIVIVGLAKRLEEVFFPEQSKSVLLPKTSSSLKLIQHLRDEAHRFAITFHRKLRDKRTLKTEITDIKGVGEKTAQKLLIHFGSVNKIKKASKEALLKVINKKTANAVYDHFHAN